METSCRFAAVGAKDKLSALLDRLEGTHERVTITRGGHAAAVLISPDDLVALQETPEAPEGGSPKIRREAIGSPSGGPIAFAFRLWYSEPIMSPMPRLMQIPNRDLGDITKLIHEFDRKHISRAGGSRLPSGGWGVLAPRWVWLSF